MLFVMAAWSLNAVPPVCKSKQLGLGLEGCM